MQPVDVLGDHRLEQAAPLELGQRRVRRGSAACRRATRSAGRRSSQKRSGSRRKASMCATSIGSTFSHSPVPGVRKSGMPGRHRDPGAGQDDGALGARAAARRAAPSRRVESRRSLALELRPALAEEGADALLRVLGAERASRSPALGLDALVQVGRVPRRVLICSTATGACSASLRAQASAVSNSSWSGTTCVREPDPVAPRRRRSGRRSGSSRAPCASPTSRGSRCVPPKPGMIPRLISGWPKVADSAAMPEVAGHRQLAAAAERDAS